ncbi:hypothetical protein BT63DRAFT_478125 [Microthyrium microscopicum]|uniref:P-loop containing nucleoside triphosphate hydrolase protein n=1 Tax=Microthyrium microscopicum TaxID=703497 RepID=A0A6A6UC84_9PEZI|nr:hypothetical protein BT63DRAFT_478125 [Microthyrium microscopicum]
MCNSPPPKPTTPLSSYVVLLSGTHVTGKETLAISLSQALQCPYIEADMVQAATTIASRSQASRGYDYSKTFGRIWFSKLRRLGFLSDGNESDGESGIDAPRTYIPRTNVPKVYAPRKVGMGMGGGLEGCTAVLTVSHMRRPAREAIQEVMLGNGIRPIFVIMGISKETLSGRTLGAEEPELARRIMEQKMMDIEEPEGEERDVLLIDSMRDVTGLFGVIMDGIERQLRDDS